MASFPNIYFLPNMLLLVVINLSTPNLGVVLFKLKYAYPIVIFLTPGLPFICLFLAVAAKARPVWVLSITDISLMQDLTISRSKFIP